MPRDLELMSEDMKQGRWTEALQKAQILLGKVPMENHAYRAIVLYNMGVCYNELGQYVEAETQYAEACREDPSDSDLWYNRANNLHHWGIYLKRLGDISGSQTHMQQAMHYARKAKDINPGDRDISNLIEIIQRSM